MTLPVRGEILVEYKNNPSEVKSRRDDIYQAL